MIRRSPLRRGTPKRKLPMASFWEKVTGWGLTPCAICGEWKARMEAHHHIRKSRLPDRAKTDARNGTCLCADCHAQVTNARLESPRPPLLDEFLEDHGLLESGRPDPKRRAA